MKYVFIFIVLLGAFVLVPMAIALSAPQGAWIKYPGNPVLAPGTPGAWDDGGVFSADIVFYNTTYRMWYSGSGSGDSRTNIGYATSDNGLSWTKHASNPVLTHESSGWDSGGVSAPTVLYDRTAGRWKMWYAGKRQISGGFRIGYATSSDGVVWERYLGNPVLDVSSDGSDDGNVLSPTVLYKNGTYHMWYAGSGARNQIYYATSSDGITWSKYAGDPVVLLGGDTEWDNGEIAAPSILATDTGFEMWYQGYSRSTEQNYIGHATSPNGNNWTKDSQNPVMGAGPIAWDEYSVFYPSVGNVNGQLMMWYHGVSAADAPQKIGLALFDQSAVPTPLPTFPPLPPDTTTPDPVGTATPTAGVFGVIINDGAPFTSQVTVTLKIKAPNTTPQMMVSNNSGFVNSQWESYADFKSWPLDPSGSHTVARKVYVKFGDAAGNMLSVRFSDIKLDNAPPTGTVTVLKTALSAASANANTLLVQVEDDVSGVGEMRFGNEPDLAGAAWEAFASTKSWSFDERGVVYAQFRDRVGNVSDIVQATLAKAMEPLFLPYTTRQ